MDKILILIACLASVAGAADITFQWDSVTNAAAYSLKHGPSPRLYTNSISTTNTTLTISNVSGQFYVAVTAIATNGIESLPSNEVNASVPQQPSLRLIIPIRSASDIQGPWFEFTNIVNVAVTDARRFYHVGKARIE